MHKFITAHWKILAGLALLAGVFVLGLVLGHNVSALSAGSGVVGLIAGWLHKPPVSGLGNLPSNGSPAQQVKQGLIDSSKIVSGLASGEQTTQSGLDKQAGDLGTASGAIADGQSILQEIADKGPDKPS